MDFIIELVIQVLVQFLVEVLLDTLLEGAFRGAARVLANRIARYVLGIVLGVGFGLFWGQHLTGGSHWPKLLWVSLALAATALVLAMGRPRESQLLYPGMLAPAAVARQAWRDVFTPPWHWSADRLLGFSLINIGLAAGIFMTFRPGL